MGQASDWLPASYKVATRRYILPEDGTEPHEWDIVVFRPNCPPRMRQSEAVLAAGVAAAFSAKGLGSDRSEAPGP